MSIQDKNTENINERAFGFPHGLRLKQIVIFTILCVFCTSFAYGQSQKTSIKVIARALPDSILLRWAPTNFEGWNAGNKYGYKILRYTLMQSGELKLNPNPTVLTPETIKPWPLPKWEKIIDIDEYAAVAGQAIYGETFELTTAKNTSVFDVINKVKEQDSRYSFALFAADMSPLAAHACGLWFTDKEVKKGEKYLYRVLLDAPNNVVLSDTGFVYTGIEEYLPLPKPLDFRAEFGDKGVILHWERKTLDYVYNSYSVERSEDGVNFKKINKQPVVYTASDDFNETRELLYIDSLATNEKQYYYRIVGHTSFGEKSPASDIVNGKGIYDVNVIPEIKEDDEANGKISLKWTYPNDEEKNIIGFKVLRSFEYKSAYDTISNLLQPNIREYIDPKPLSVNYYKIAVYSKSGLSKASVPSMVQLVDSIPPVPPVGLKAVIDTTGKVVLSWKPNTERDIFGYRIYRANEANDEFSQITIAPVEDSMYVDTVNIKTLSPKVYYRLLAIDKRQNHSDFSEVLAVERPDIIPPAPPVIKSIKSSTTGIRVEWIESSSKDVAKHILMRKEKKSKNLVVIKEIARNDSLRWMTDSSAVTNEIYYYSLVAIDKNGNHSEPSIEMAGQKIPSSNQERLGELKCKADRKNLLIEITWQTPLEKVKRYTIYRKVGENSMYVVYTTITGEYSKFIDKKIKQDTRFSYMVKAIMEDGNGRLSNEVEVKF